MKSLAKLPACWAVIIALVLFAGASYVEANESGEYDDYNAKIYGIIEKMPADGKEGLWVINERDIFITGDTEIKEGYGKAVIGAYVEITGNYEGEKFTAYKIEVKMEKKGD